VVLAFIIHQLGRIFAGTLAGAGEYLCLSEIKLAHTDDEVRQKMA
jgi:hypothetical protein